MPTELERSGNFSQSVDLNNRLIAIAGATSQQPLPGNRVPATALMRTDRRF